MVGQGLRLGLPRDLSSRVPTEAEAIRCASPAEIEMPRMRALWPAAARTAADFPESGVPVYRHRRAITSPSFSCLCHRSLLFDLSSPISRILVWPLVLECRSVAAVDRP